MHIHMAWLSSPLARQALLTSTADKHAPLLMLITRVSVSASVSVLVSESVGHSVQ